MTSRAGGRDLSNVPDVPESIMARASEEHARYDMDCKTRESNTWYAGMDNDGGIVDGRVREIPQRGFNLFRFLAHLALAIIVVFVVANVFVSCTLMFP